MGRLLLAAASAVVLSGCGSPATHGLEVQDDDGWRYCGQANDDGTLTFGLSSVRNTGDDTVVAVEAVRFLDATGPLEAVGGYFLPRPGPRNGAPFEVPDDGGVAVEPGDVAQVVIGARLTGASPAEAAGAEVTYRTESGRTGVFTTKIALQVLAQGAECLTEEP